MFQWLDSLLSTPFLKATSFIATAFFAILSAIAQTQPPERKRFWVRVGVTGTIVSLVFSLLTLSHEQRDSAKRNQRAAQQFDSTVRKLGAIEQLVVGNLDEARKIKEQADTLRDQLLTTLSKQDSTLLKQDSLTQRADSMATSLARQGEAQRHMLQTQQSLAQLQSRTLQQTEELVNPIDTLSFLLGVRYRVQSDTLRRYLEALRQQVASLPKAERTQDRFAVWEGHDVITGQGLAFLRAQHGSGSTNELDTWFFTPELGMYVTVPSDNWERSDWIEYRVNPGDFRRADHQSYLVIYAGTDSVLQVVEAPRTALHSRTDVTMRIVPDFARHYLRLVVAGNSQNLARELANGRVCDFMLYYGRHARETLALKGAFSTARAGTNLEFRAPVDEADIFRSRKQLPKRACARLQA